MLVDEDGPYWATGGATPRAVGRQVWGPPFPAHPHNMVGLWYRGRLRDTREASNCGRVRVRIIHGLIISHKELTYLLQKSIVIETKNYTHAPRGRVGRS